MINNLTKEYLDYYDKNNYLKAFLINKKIEKNVKRMKKEEIDNHKILTE